jgi:hypothetical protein
MQDKVVLDPGGGSSGGCILESRRRIKCSGEQEMDQVVGEQEKVKWSEEQEKDKMSLESGMRIRWSWNQK